MTDVVTYIVFLAIGKLAIYLLQLFPLANWLANRRWWLRDLLDCDLCLGVWIYTALAWIFGVNIVQFYKYELVMFFITGFVSSFIMHLISLGWDAKFRVMEIR